MGVINLLSNEVSQLISAGEVVERPLSVVKELVENAIDAGAKRIEIKIKNGGKSYISVKDDGVGMDKEDLQKCLFKYATSKVSEKDDLFNIITLGFRGEALFSISAVSKMRIQTRWINEAIGSSIYAVGGEINELRDVPAEKGTFIEVEDLFYNIPARKKFLKSDGWERQLILKFIEELSLLYPEKTFILNSDGKDVLVLQGVNDVYKRVICLFPDLVNKVKTFRSESLSFNCNIFISTQNAEMSEFYVYAVNKRLVKEKVINRVVKDVFEKQSNKPSFLFMDFSLPPYEIDVNVHPSKKEIKFRNSEKVYSFLRETLESSLKEKYIPFFEVKISKEDDKDKINLSVREKSFDYDIAGIKISTADSRLFDFKDEEYGDTFKIIGVFAHCFLLIEMRDELIIIDQHALHERLIYNRLLENLDRDKSSKKMILPYIFNVTESIRDYLEEKRKDFEEIGFLYEEMGPRTYALTETPSALDFDSAVYAFSELIKNEDRIIKNKKDISKELLALYACKSAIKKGDSLDKEEIKKVLMDYINNRSESFCPHGRSFIARITLSEMEKMFGRKK